MLVNPTSSSSSTSSSVSPLSGGPTLGKNDFLKLLITQLKNQDPLSPMDQNQFLAQTAQFTSLEDLQNISQGLTDLKTVMSGTGLTSSAALLGRTVRAAGQQFSYDGRTPATLDFSLDTSVSNVEIDVVDASGNVVQQMMTGPIEAGAHSVAWNGQDAQGGTMSAGSYLYRVAANGAPGAAAAVTGIVSGISQSSGGLLYRIGDSTVLPADIVDVA